MDESSLRQILSAVEAGRLSAEEAHHRLRDMQYDDLGFAKIDVDREQRCGLPEAIFCQGKTTAQVVAIARSLLESSGRFLATRVSADAARALAGAFPDAEQCAAARTVAVKRAARAQPAGEIAVICAGTSDIPVAEEARVTAEFLDNRTRLIADVGIAALHRLVNHIDDLRRAGVVIAVAGMEGALASVAAGLISRPVIAVPTSVGYGASFGGLAALLAMMNSCAAGVAVVNIDNGFGAGCIASLINHTGGADDTRKKA